LSKRPKKRRQVRLRLLEAFLLSGKAAVRRQALRSLLSLDRSKPTEEAADLLRLALQDRDAKIRKTAIEEIGLLGDPSRLGALRRHLREENDTELADAARQTLILAERTRIDRLIRRGRFRAAADLAGNLALLGADREMIEHLLDHIGWIRREKERRERQDADERRRQAARSQLKTAARHLSCNEIPQTRVALHRALRLDPLNPVAQKMLSSLPRIVANLDRTRCAETRSEWIHKTCRLRLSAADALARHDYGKAEGYLLSLRSIRPRDPWARRVSQDLPSLRLEQRRVEAEREKDNRRKRVGRMKALAVHDVRQKDWASAERRLCDLAALCPQDGRVKALQDAVERSSREETVSAALEEAGRSVNAGEFNQADDTLRRCILRAPDPKPVRAAMERVATLRDERAQSLRRKESERLDRAIANYRKQIENGFSQGRIYEAAVAARKILSLAPSDRHALDVLKRVRQRHRESRIGFLRNRTVALLKRGNSDKAWRLIQIIVTRSPGDIELTALKDRIKNVRKEQASESQWRAIQKQAEKGGLDEVEKIIHHALADDPNPGRLERMLRLVPRLRAEREKEAERKRRERREASLRTLRNKAQKAFGSGLHGKAGSIAQEMLALNPADTYAAELLTQIESADKRAQCRSLRWQIQQHLEAAEFDQAEKLVRALSAVEGKREEAQRLLEDLQTWRQKHEEGLARKAASERRARVATLRSSIERRSKRGEHEKAILQARELLILTPTDRDTKALLEQCEARLRDEGLSRKIESLHQKACKDLQRGNFTQARKTLQELTVQALKTGKGLATLQSVPAVDNACQMLERLSAEETNRQTATGLLSESNTLFGQGRIAECIERIRRAIAFDPGNGQAMALFQRALEANAVLSRQRLIRSRTRLNQYGELVD